MMPEHDHFVTKPSPGRGGEGDVAARTARAAPSIRTIGPTLGLPQVLIHHFVLFRAGQRVTEFLACFRACAH